MYTPKLFKIKTLLNCKIKFYLKNKTYQYAEIRPVCEFLREGTIAGSPRNRALHKNKPSINRTMASYSFPSFFFNAPYPHPCPSPDPSMCLLGFLGNPAMIGHVARARSVFVEY